MKTFSILEVTKANIYSNSGKEQIMKELKWLETGSGKVEMPKIKIILVEEVRPPPLLLTLSL